MQITETSFGAKFGPDGAIQHIAIKSRKTEQTPAGLPAVNWELLMKVLVALVEVAMMLAAQG